MRQGAAGKQRQGRALAAQLFALFATRLLMGGARLGQQLRSAAADGAVQSRSGDHRSAAAREPGAGGSMVYYPCKRSAEAGGQGGENEWRGGRSASLFLIVSFGPSHLPLRW